MINNLKSRFKDYIKTKNIHLNENMINKMFDNYDKR